MTEPLGDSYYHRLEVGRSASHEDIVHAYRRLALGAHPDAHPDDPAAAGRFRALTEAYEVLADPGRRAAYDRQVPGRPIEVRVGGTRRARSGRGDLGARAYHEGAPVVLGTASSGVARPARDVPLLVGPVRVARAGEGSDVSSSRLDDLLRLSVDSWWTC